MVKTLRFRHNGAVLTVPCTFDESAHVGEFNALMAEVIKTEGYMKKEQTSDSADRYGRAIKRLYNLIFGVAQAGAIESFFSPDMLAMVCAVNPFIRDKVAPAVRKASARNTEAAKREFLRQQKARLMKH